MSQMTNTTHRLSPGETALKKVWFWHLSKKRMKERWSIENPHDFHWILSNLLRSDPHCRLVRSSSAFFRCSLGKKSTSFAAQFWFLGTHQPNQKDACFFLCCTREQNSTVKQLGQNRLGRSCEASTIQALATMIQNAWSGASKKQTVMNLKRWCF